jgi:hypothetical protein
VSCAALGTHGIKIKSKLKWGFPPFRTRSDEILEVIPQGEAANSRKETDPDHVCSLAAIFCNVISKLHEPCVHSWMLLKGLEGVLGLVKEISCNGFLGSLIWFEIIEQAGVLQIHNLVCYG